MGWSQVELSSEPLQAAAIWRILRQVLPAAQCRALQELGAADHQVAVAGADEPLTLTAVSTGDDVWVEVRRRPGDAPADADAPAPRAGALSLARPAAPRQAHGPQLAVDTQGPLEALLIAAAAQAATDVYLAPNATPMIRSAGRISPLRHGDALAAPDLDQVLMHAAAQAGAAPGAEWVIDAAGVGRVRCVPFTDESGTGMLFELPASDALAATEAGLEPAVRALTRCADGLVIVTGPRSSGKSTLLDTLVDLVNRSRNDHVITIATRVRTVYASRNSFVSQRTVRGDALQFAAAVRAALREGPDVLVLDGGEAPEIILVAMEAARAGRLVCVSVAAANATAAVARVLAGFAVERQPEVRALLADCLRGVVAQVLLGRIGGGRVAAREVLLGSPAVAQLIARGGDARLPVAIQAGRRAGMKTLEDSLVSLVRSRAVTVAEATRAANDPASLTRALQRENLGSDLGFQSGERSR